MNPARALAPALLSGAINDLWLYWTAPFVGTSLAAILFRGKFTRQRKSENF
jgi:aquaporin Z